MKWGILIGICLMAVTVHAETMYVDDAVKYKLGLRPEPGLNHKVTDMIEAGPVEVLRNENDWSYIRLPESGKEGWLSNRFITNKKPNVLEIKELKKKQDKLSEQNIALTEDNKKLKTENEKLTAEIVEKQNKIKELSNTIGELKVDPKPEFKSEETIIEPKREIPKPEPKRQESERNPDMIDIIKSLEMNQIIKGALIGVGILVIGYIMGSRSSGSRRRRTYY